MHPAHVHRYPTKPHALGISPCQDMPGSLVLGKMLGLGGIAGCAVAICVFQILGTHSHGCTSIIQFYKSFRIIRKASTVLSLIFYSQLGCNVQVCFMERDWATRRPPISAVDVEVAIIEVYTKFQAIWAIPQCSATPSFVVLYAKIGKSLLFPLCHVYGLHAGPSNFVEIQSEVLTVIP